MSKLRNLPKNKKKLINAIIKGKDYDYTYLLQFEQLKLQSILEYFQRSTVVDHHRDIQRIQLCINLLQILIDEPFGKKCNTKNKHRFDLFGVESNLPDKYIINGLYIEKAKHLYYELRKTWTDTWWD